MSEEDLRRIAELITETTSIYSKEILNADEAARYMSIVKSYLYKLTMRNEIPYYKPSGKLCYFKREDLDAWLLSNRVATAEENAAKAMSYCMNNKLNINRRKSK